MTPFFVSRSRVLADSTGTEIEPLTMKQLMAAGKAGVAIGTSVESSTSSVAILYGHGGRMGARIRNTDENVLYLDLTGGTATAELAHVALAQNESYVLDACYVGTITGIWAGDGSGLATVVQFVYE